MARYIDADRLVAWCIETFRTQSTVAGKAYVRALLDGVDSCPTANVAPIADTVRKMHSEIKDRCIKGGIYPAFVARTIDEIAEEMLEGIE